MTLAGKTETIERFAMVKVTRTDDPKSKPYKGMTGAVLDIDPTGDYPRCTVEFSALERTPELLIADLDLVQNPA